MGTGFCARLYFCSSLRVWMRMYSNSSGNSYPTEWELHSVQETGGPQTDQSSFILSRWQTLYGDLWRLSCFVSKLDIPFYFILFYFLRRLTLSPWLSWNSWCRPGYSWTHRDTPVPASRVVALKFVFFKKRLLIWCADVCPCTYTTLQEWKSEDDFQAVVFFLPLCGTWSWNANDQVCTKCIYTPGHPASPMLLPACFTRVLGLSILGFFKT